MEEKESRQQQEHAKFNEIKDARINALEFSLNEKQQ
jgi:hypothetical protein